MPRVSLLQKAQVAAGPADRISVTAISSRVVTAVRTGSGDLKVIVWDVGSDGSLTRRGDAVGGPVTQTSITDWPQGPGVVTAVRTASGELKVISWKIGDDGSITRASDASGGPIDEVVVSSPSVFSGVITPVRTASGELKVISWKIDAGGSITRASDASGGVCSAITVTAISGSGGSGRIATALRNGSGNLEIITWAISGTGVVTRLHEAVAGPIAEVTVTYRTTPNANLVSITRGPSGDLTVIGWLVKDDGTIERQATAQGGNIGGAAVTTWKPDLHSYAVGALKGPDTAKLKLIVWRIGGDLKRHGEIVGPDIQTVAVTFWSHGVITVCRNSAGNLELISWQLEPKGIKLLYQVWPAVSPTFSSASFTDLVKEESHHERMMNYGENLVAVVAQGPDSLILRGGDGSDLSSPSWQNRFFPSASGVDPMIAAGHLYVIVTQDHRIVFLDRNGSQLQSKAGESTNLSATSFFGQFIAETNPDGSQNINNINLDSPQKINEFYDTRVAYDSATKRFAILSAARKSQTPNTRFFAFAVSKTEDPRDGFHQYISTESNFRDFPRLSIHAGKLLVAHNAEPGPPPPEEAEGETPVLYVFDYPSLRQGVLEIPNWQYYSSELHSGDKSVVLTLHHGDSGGMSFLADMRGRTDAKLRIVGFPIAGDPWLAPNPVLAVAPLSQQPPGPGPFLVYRKNSLYLAGHVQITPREPNLRPPRMSILSIKIPFNTISSSQLIINNPGIVEHIFGLNAPSDAPTDKVSYDRPGISVNKDGDIIYVYGRTGVETIQPLFPQVRYSVWYHAESAPRWSALLQEGSYQPTWFYDADAKKDPPAESTATSITHAYKLDYATAVVDPLDDTAFWIIHEYADDASKSWKTVVGVVNPAGS